VSLQGLLFPEGETELPQQKRRQSAAEDIAQTPSVEPFAGNLVLDTDRHVAEFQFGRTGFAEDVKTSPEQLFIWTD